MRSPLRGLIGLGLGLALAGYGVIVAAQTQRPPVPTRQALAPEAVGKRYEPAPTLAAISGRITRSIDGTPLVRARVTVAADEIFECPPDTLEKNTPRCPRYVRVELTDKDGRYSISKLPAGTTYTVSASKTGFATRLFAQTGVTPTSTPFTLTEKESRTNVDIALDAEIVVAGTLLDTDGTPLGGALVSARPADAVAKSADEATSIAESVTDEFGQFRLSGLSTGRYVVNATDASFTRVGDSTGLLRYDSTFFPGTLNPKDATVLTLVAGQTPAPIKFTLAIGQPTRVVQPALDPSSFLPPVVPGQKVEKNPKPAPAPPRPPAPTAVITGRITAIDGTPLARSRVVLSGDDLFDCAPGTPAGMTDDCTRYVRVAITDKDGGYAFDRLPRSKTYVVTASKTAYAGRAFGETPPAVPPAYVELKEGERKEKIDVQLVPHNYISGALTDQDQTPFAGALVEAQRAIYDNKGQRSFVVAAESVTDDQGHFHLNGLAPGQYFLTAFDPAYARVGDELGQLFYGPTFYPGTVYQDDAVRLTLDPGIPVEGLQFKLQIVRPARLKGTISAAGGLQLLSGAVNIGPSRNSRSASFATADADIRPDGAFQFANILAERYVIRARAAVSSDNVSHFALWTQPIEGADVVDVNMALSPGARVEGRVRWDGKTNRPPVDQENIRVRAPMADGSAFGDVLSARIDLNRNFSLLGAMAGNHVFRLDNLPDPWTLKQVLLRGADITDIPYPLEYKTTYDGMEIVLTDVFTTLSGRAIVAPNDLAQGYAVIALPTNRLQWQPTSRFIKIAYLDDRGSFSIRALPPAEYYVAITRAADQSDLTNDVLLDRLSRDAPTIRLIEGQRARLTLQAFIPKR